MKKVTIIVPVYNAENSIKNTIESLLLQFCRDIEILFIDDKSTDSSFHNINMYIPRFEEKGMKAKIISHQQNLGVAAARNTGLKHATGDYVYYVDADDTIEPDTIDLLIKEAERTQVDIVGCNWFLSFEKNERKMSQPAFSNSLEAIQWVMVGKMRWNLWLFLVKRSLYEDDNIRFIPGMNMGEDLMVMIKLFAVAKKVCYLNKALYHYGQSNEQSLTKTYSEHHIEQVTANVHEIEIFLQKSPYAINTLKWMNDLKLNIKLPLLISDRKTSYQKWRNWFPESNAYAARNKMLSGRIRLLQWAASKKQDWILRIHYYLVVRVVYGIIYK